MIDIGHRGFLVRTGLALSAAVLASTSSRTLANQQPSPYRFTNWEDLRTQFLLSPQLIHMAAFFLASHPTSVRKAIERHRAGLDADPIGYWFEQEEKQEANVLKAAAEYLGANPTDIALTDSTTMGLGLLYGGLKLGNEHEILTTTHDHYSTETTLRLRAERTGAMVRPIHLYRSLKTVSRDEIVESLRKGITPMTRIVAVTWVHSSTGLKLPIHEMAQAIQAINRSRDERDRIIFCVDGVHALGVEDFRWMNSAAIFSSPERISGYSAHAAPGSSGVIHGPGRSPKRRSRPSAAKPMTSGWRTNPRRISHHQST